jgi:uncharacterized protein (DUF1697 family)
MATYFAFLRGMNLGKRNVKMDELRALFAEVKLENVRSYIASGNIIFDTKEKDEKKLTARIEKHLKDSLGYDVKVMLRSQAELAAVLKNNPFKNPPEGAKTYINFYDELPAKPAMKKFLEERSSETEVFKFQGRELYMLFHVGFSESQFFKNPKSEKQLGVLATNRNLNTPTKMLALLEKE